jgi:hypothetical protein
MYNSLFPAFISVCCVCVFVLCEISPKKKKYKLEGIFFCINIFPFFLGKHHQLFEKYFLKQMFSPHLDFSMVAFCLTNFLTI